MDSVRSFTSAALFPALKQLAKLALVVWLAFLTPMLGTLIADLTTDREDLVTTWDIEYAAGSDAAPSVPAAVFAAHPQLRRFDCEAATSTPRAGVSRARCVAQVERGSIIDEILAGGHSIFYPMALAHHGWQIVSLRHVADANPDHLDLRDTFDLSKAVPAWSFAYQALVALLLAAFLFRTGAPWRPAHMRDWAWVLAPLVISLAVSNTAGRFIEDPRTEATMQAFAEAMAAAPWETALMTLLLAPALEELVFRGAGWRFLRQPLGGPLTLLLTSLPFAGLHMAQYGAFGFVSALVTGLALGWVRERSGALLPCIVAHALVNGVGFVLMAVQG